MDELDREIMRLLPDAATSGDFTPTPRLYQRLQGHLLKTPTIKTVGRRLQEMERAGLVESGRDGTASTWRRKAGAGGMAPKGGSTMTFDQALALQTLKRFSARQIPELVSESLLPMFDLAKARLSRANSEAEQKYARWANKVAVASGGFALHCRPVNPALFAKVSRALFEERKLDAVYRPRWDDSKAKAKTLLPLGIAEVGSQVYLIADMENKPEPTMYRLDRFESVEVTFETFVYPQNFSLDAYVNEQRKFDFKVGADMQLELRFTSGRGDHLLETPLCADQRDQRDGDALLIRGTVPMSQRLHWWLRSFGPYVEVLEPVALREAFAAEARALARLYD